MDIGHATVLAPTMEAYRIAMVKEKSVLKRLIAASLSISILASSGTNAWASRGLAGKGARVPGMSMNMSPASLGGQTILLTGLSSGLIAPSLSLNIPNKIPTTVSEALTPHSQSLAVMAAPTILPALQESEGATVNQETAIKGQPSGKKNTPADSILGSLDQTMELVNQSMETNDFHAAGDSIGALFEGSGNRKEGGQLPASSPPANNKGGSTPNDSGKSNKYPHTTGVVTLTQLPMPGTSLRFNNTSNAPAALKTAIAHAVKGENNGYVIITSPIGISGKSKTAILAKVKPNGPNSVLLQAEARIQIANVSGKAHAGIQTATISKVLKEEKSTGNELQGEEYGEIMAQIFDDMMAMAEVHPEVGDLAEQVLEMDQNSALKTLFANVSIEWQHKVIGFDSKLDQLKVISESFSVGREYLNKSDDKDLDFPTRIKNAKLPPEVEKHALEEAAALEKSKGQGGDAKIEQWLEFTLGLPWNKRTTDNLDLAHARSVLDRDHFGLEKVKTRILEFLSVRKRLKNKKGAILLFTGPPGTGKTSIAKGIAEAMGREYVRIALGGVSNESKIRGHGRTYQGSKAGVILETLRRAKSKNPIMVLDELEKMPTEGSANGDPMAALLEVLDPEQNHAFTDHYLDLPFDLSEVLFIATANDLSRIPGPLRDRLEIIEYSAYTDGEKIEIGKKYLDARARKETGLTTEEAALSRDGLAHLIRHYTMEAGVRNLTRAIEGLYRKIVAKIETGEGFDQKELSPEAIDSLIGPAPIGDGKKANNAVGVASALAVSGAGGSILPIEVNAFPNGKGKVEITGNLKETMNESARVAMTVVRSKAQSLGIDDALFNTMDVHIHVPQGGTPKDGPSAGITLTTAISSRLTGRPVKAGVAMTGEVYTNGEVHAIGGLKEKAMGAAKMGYTTVLYPKDNEKDVADIPEEVRNKLTLIAVEHIDEVLDLALEKEAAGPALQAPSKASPNKFNKWLTGLLIGGAAVASAVGAYVAGLI